MRVPLTAIALCAAACGVSQPAPPLPIAPGPAFPPPIGPAPAQPLGVAPVPQGFAVQPVQPVVAGAPAMAPAGFRTVTRVTGSPWSFAVPSGWQEVPPPFPGILIAIRDPLQIGGLFPNANLVTEPYALGDGSMYASANLPLLASNAVVLGQRPAAVGSLPGADIEARWVAAIPPYRTVQRYTAHAGLGYVLTCTGADSVFESVRPTCDAILNSFRVSP